MKQAIKIITYMMIAMMVIIASACQPTPENEIVIPKENTEQMVYESSNDDENTQFEYDVPEHVTDRFSIKDGSLDIIIDADVYMPDVESIPVAKVIYDPFTVERAENLKDYFMGDGVLVSEWIPTKEYYDERIIEAQKGYMDNGEYIVDEEHVNYLIEQRANAPQEDIQIPITELSFSEDEELRSRIKVENEIVGGLLIRNDRFIFYQNDRWIRSAEQTYYDINDKPIEVSSKEIDMTEQQAIDWAQRVLTDFNIDYMSPVNAEKIYYTQAGDTFGDILCGGYQVEFMRQLGGIASANIVPSSLSVNDKYEVMPPIGSEKIRMSVDEYGVITEFWWENPAKQIDILTEHVDILAFDEVMARFEEFAQIQCAYEASLFCSFLSVKRVYDIRFNLIYLPIKNNPNEFMLAPCWCFTYKDSLEYTEEDLEYLEQLGMEPVQEDLMGDDYFILSAVDGASISPYTYKEYEDMKNRE